MGDLVIDMVAKYLKKNGFDGLYSDGECGCLLEDLAPCGNLLGDCKPGFKHEATEETERRKSDGYDWFISPSERQGIMRDDYWRFEMEGIQKSVYEFLLELEQKVKNGFYGKDDDFEVWKIESEIEDFIDKY